MFRDGATVIAVDRNVAAACETVKPFGDGHMFAEMDVSSQPSISSAIKEIMAKYNRPPSIIVNSAGITRDNFILKMSEQDFDAVVSVNLKVGFVIYALFKSFCITS